MGLMDALLNIGAGTTRGYRASQETRRQIAEATRKALLESEEMSIKRREVETLEGLRSAQAEAERRQTETAGSKEGREAGAFTARSRKVLPGSRMAVLLGELGIPDGTVGDIEDSSKLIDRMLEEKSGRSLRRDFPEQFGGKSRTPRTPEETRASLFGDFVGRIDPYVLADETQRGPVLDFIFEGVRRYEREFGGRGAGADSTGVGGGRLDDAEAHRRYEAFKNRKRK